MIYELFDAALRSAGISAQRRDRFADRGDGLLALIDPADQALLLSLALPAFSRLLAGYNASLPEPTGRDRRLRVRVAVHSGNVHDDDNGCFGEALDIAFRLLDAPSVKETLKMARGAVLLVVSSDIHDLLLSYSGGNADHTASCPSPFRSPATTTRAGYTFPQKPPSRPPISSSHHQPTGSHWVDRKISADLIGLGAIRVRCQTAYGTGAYARLNRPEESICAVRGSVPGNSVAPIPGCPELLVMRWSTAHSVVQFDSSALADWYCSGPRLPDKERNLIMWVHLVISSSACSPRSRIA